MAETATVPVHAVRFTFEGEEGFSVECREDEDVVSAALRQGHILFTECREGVCATCKGFLEDGDYDELLPHTVHALSPTEEDEGYVLTCRLQPRSDLVIDYDYPADRVQQFTEGVWAAQIVELDRLSETVARVVVRTLSSQDPVQWEPGQHVRLTLPSIGVTRDFSMANLSSSSRELEFLVRLLPGGAFSGYIGDGAKVGDRIDVAGPFGRFLLRPSGLTPVFVAGGTGLAPIMAMLRALAAERPDAGALLFFGNTNAGDLFFEKELDALERELPGLQTWMSLLHPGPDWTGDAGLVTDALAVHLQDPNDHAFYLCGPPPMVAATKRLLAERGVPREQIFEETFIPSGATS